MQPQTATSHSQQPRGIERRSQNTSLEYEILLLLDTTKPRCPPFNALFPYEVFCMNTTGLCMHRIYAITQILTASIEATSHPGKYVTEKTTP